MFELVRALTELAGPAGYEDAVQNWLLQRWQELGLQVRVTSVGNLIARLGGQGPKLLIGAHADEIGFRVKSIDQEGFLWLSAGTSDADKYPPEPVPLGHVARVITETGTLEGTFVTITGHVMTRQQRAHYEAHAIDWMDFYVDVGACSREEAEAWGIHPGCPVINAVPTRRCGANIVGKAMDDRAGLAVITTMAERIDRSQMKYEVWLASTVMEEVGLIGARSAASGFDQGIIVEVGLAGDIPLVDHREMPVALGRGPILVHKDMRVHYDKHLTQALTRSARTLGIDVQHATFQNYSSDGKEWIQEGVPTALVAFPCRHTHSPYETVRERDLQQIVDLLVGFVEPSPV
jgi:endoglucanase